MNFRQLQTFLEIVRLGSFAAAASKLNATQSTVSARIHELEQDLNTVLFDRSQRRATVTAKGRELAGYAERALLLQEEIRQQIGSREDLSGVVRVGVAELVAMTWLPKLAKVLHERYPKITLELDIALTSPLRARLLSGELDVALIPGTAFDPGYVALALGSVEFCWMAGSEFETPDRPLVPEDFKSFRILSLGEHSYHFNTVSAWLAGNGSAAQRPDLCNSMTVLSTLAAASVGVSLLPPICYAAELERGDLKILETAPAPEAIPFNAVYKRRQLSLLQELVSETAVEVSTFDAHTRPRAPAGRAGR